MSVQDLPAREEAGCWPEPLEVARPPALAGQNCALRTAEIRLTGGGPKAGEGRLVAKARLAAKPCLAAVARIMSARAGLAAKRCLEAKAALGAEGRLAAAGDACPAAETGGKRPCLTPAKAGLTGTEAGLAGSEAVLAGAIACAPPAAWSWSYGAAWLSAPLAPPEKPASSRAGCASAKPLMEAAAA